MFIFIKIKNIKISFTKINKFLNKLNNLSYKNILYFIQSFPNKIKIILKNILVMNILIQNSNYKSLILIKVFANKNLITKKIQPRAKGQTFYIQKKSSNLFFYFCTQKLYKLFHFINLII